MMYLIPLHILQGSYGYYAQPDDVFDNVGFHVPTMVSEHTLPTMISHNTSYMKFLVV